MCPATRKLALHPYGILRAVADATAFAKGEWGAEIVDVVASQEGEVIVEGERGLDSFASTNLASSCAGAATPRSRSADS